MTEHATRVIALPLDSLDRTTARYRHQVDDYRAATELTMSRALYEELGATSLLFATLSAEVPPLATAEGVAAQMAADAEAAYDEADEL